MMGTLPRRVAYAALLMSALPAAAAAQVTYPQPAYPQPAPPAAQPAPPAGAANPVCGRLEAQLAAIDRGAGADPARAEQTRRIEETLNRQQADLDRTRAQWQRLGCQPPGLFSIFASQSPQCGPLNNQIGQIRAAIDRTTAEMGRWRRTIAVPNMPPQRPRKGFSKRCSAVSAIRPDLSRPEQRTPSLAAAAIGRYACARVTAIISRFHSPRRRPDSPKTSRPARGFVRPPKRCCSPIAIRARMWPRRSPATAASTRISRTLSATGANS